MVALRDTSDLSRPIGPPWLLDVVRDITALGSTAVLALLVTIVTTFLFATGKRHAGLFILTTVLSGALLNTLLKLAFARARPDIVTPLTQVSTLSFPSGHAASSAVCLSDARLDARSDASFPLSSHSSHNDRRDPDPVWSVSAAYISEFTIRAMCWRAGASALRGRKLARCSCRIFSVPEGSSSRVTSPRYGGIADHPRTCRWFNPVVMSKSEGRVLASGPSGRCGARPTRQAGSCPRGAEGLVQAFWVPVFPSADGVEVFALEASEFSLISS